MYLFNLGLYFCIFKQKFVIRSLKANCGVLFFNTYIGLNISSQTSSFHALHIIARITKFFRPWFSKTLVVVKSRG